MRREVNKTPRTLAKVLDLYKRVRAEQAESHKRVVVLIDSILGEKRSVSVPMYAQIAVVAHWTTDGRIRATKFSASGEGLSVAYSHDHYDGLDDRRLAKEFGGKIELNNKLGRLVWETEREHLCGLDRAEESLALTAALEVHSSWNRRLHTVQMPITKTVLDHMHGKIGRQKLYNGEVARVTMGDMVVYCDDKGNVIFPMNVHDVEIDTSQSVVSSTRLHHWQLRKRYGGWQ
jgi:hypothetical protein